MPAEGGAPRLTVAVPTFNGERHIEAALRGILDQESPAFDLLVSDDRSDDRTRERVRSIAGDRACIEVNPERLGLAGNWNRCMQRARTDWVIVFHQDDLMRPGHLRLIERAVAKVDALGSVVGFLAGPADAIDDRGDPLDAAKVEAGRIGLGTGIPSMDLGLGARLRCLATGQLLPDLAWHNPLRCSAVTLNRGVHQALGGFDSSWKYAVDWEYWSRAATRYGVGWVEPPAGSPTIAFRWHVESETHRFKAAAEDLEEQRRLIEAQLARITGGRVEKATLERKAATRLGRAYLNRAFDAASAGDRRLEAHCLREAVCLWPPAVWEVLRSPRTLGRLLVGKK